MVTHAEVIRRLEADLLAQRKLSLTWFDVMSVLERTPEHRIRMHKLAMQSSSLEAALPALLIS